MGFWDSVGNAAKGAVNALESHNAEIQELRERFEREDDDFLKGKIRSGSTEQKDAAGYVLKGRGYDLSEFRN